MNDKIQKMGDLFAKANAIMVRANQISPKVPSKGQPTLGESFMVEGISGGDYIDSYTPNRKNTNMELTSGAQKLPKDILDALIQNPIQEHNQITGLSVLDNIPIKPQRAVVNEDYGYGEKPIPTTSEMFANKNRNYGQTTVQQPSVNVDYGLISTIIKAAISEEISKLRKTMINESKQNNANGDVIIKVGNGIQFITNNGNVYEGKVKLVGNIKDN